MDNQYLGEHRTRSFWAGQAQNLKNRVFEENTEREQHTKSFYNASYWALCGQYDPDPSAWALWSWEEAQHLLELAWKRLWAEERRMERFGDYLE